MSYFLKIPPFETELLHAAPVDRCREMTKETVVFRKFVNGPETSNPYLHSVCLSFMGITK